jgi:hypothetical protein
VIAAVEGPYRSFTVSQVTVQSAQDSLHFALSFRKPLENLLRKPIHQLVGVCKFINGPFRPQARILWWFFPENCGTTGRAGGLVPPAAMGRRSLWPFVKAALQPLPPGEASSPGRCCKGPQACSGLGLRAGQARPRARRASCGCESVNFPSPPVGSALFCGTRSFR